MAMATDAPHADDAEALRSVLAATLADIEAMVAHRSVYGIPIEDEQHPWHGIVKRLRASLTAREI